MSDMPENLLPVWDRIEQRLQSDLRQTRRGRHRRRMIFGSTLCAAAIITTVAIAAPNAFQSVFGGDRHAGDQVAIMATDRAPLIDQSTSSRDYKIALKMLDSIVKSSGTKPTGTARVLLDKLDQPDGIGIIAATNDKRQLCSLLFHHNGGGGGSCDDRFTRDIPVRGPYHQSHTEPSWAASVIPDDVTGVWIISDSGRHKAEMHPNAYYWMSEGIDYPHGIEATLADGSHYKADFAPPAPGDADAKWEQAHGGTPSWRPKHPNVIGTLTPRAAQVE